MAQLNAVVVTLSTLLFTLSLFSVAMADDSAVMSKLLKSLTPPPSGWSPTAPFCKWDGIECDASNRVTSISLLSQSLAGTLPSDLNSLSQLTSLSLHNNSLSGPLPSLANLSALETVSLGLNNFTSVPDGCFWGLTGLRFLSLSNNVNLAPWRIPTDLTHASYLGTLKLGNTNIVGSLPDFFDSFPSLQSVRLSYNNLTGGLPKSLGASGIGTLQLNNNELSGTIEVLSSMTLLSQACLHDNQFTGPIPDLSKCKNLFDLDLGDNQFVGVVPSSLTRLSSLQTVSLDNNLLQGPVPEFVKGVKVTLDGINSFCQATAGPCDDRVMVLLEISQAFGYPVQLANSWKGNDPCRGWSFVVCTEGKITTVNFAKHGLQGTVSPAFANLTDLRNLYLDGNNLTGSIPESLTTLPQLESLDVSNNNLSGEVPKFPSRVKLTTAGNLLLGQTPRSGGGGRGKLLWIAVAGTVIIATIFVALVLFVYCKCYAENQHQRSVRLSDPENGNGIFELGVMNVSNDDGGAPSELQSGGSGDRSNHHVSGGGKSTFPIQLLKESTNNFSKDNIVGRGGFAVVYKGELPDGTKIAVKRMNSDAMDSQGMNDFQAEIDVLSEVRHRHLVSLLGHCIDEDERLLVYEYMPQGTLEQHLFKRPKHGYAPLTWKERLIIALDVARGVEYLHSLAREIFIHRDLKPSNILLDDAMRAKVADFGLVKNAPHGKSSVETDRVIGTFGYLAPEYAGAGRVTTKVDVFAFGAILMELITGRKALDNTLPKERSHLVTWFRQVLNNKETVPQKIDETLNPDKQTMDSIYKVAELARHCTASEPSQRRDMGYVVNVLAPLVEQWEPTNPEEEDSCGIDPQISLPPGLQRLQANEGNSSMSG